MTMRILRAAPKEVEQAADWYEDKRPGLGEEFLQELDAVYLGIEEHPHRALRISLPDLDEREFHRVIPRKFPYKVIYEVTDKEVLVLAVAHMRRKPNYWADRV